MSTNVVEFASVLDCYNKCIFVLLLCLNFSHGEGIWDGCDLK
jgi:hypothetical protein